MKIYDNLVKIAIVVVSFSVFYHLVIFPNNKMKLVSEFESKQRARLFECNYQAKKRYEKVWDYNCKSTTKEHKKSGSCSISNHISDKADEVYRDDRELCIKIYKTKLNIDL